MNEPFPENSSRRAAFDSPLSVSADGLRAGAELARWTTGDIQVAPHEFTFAGPA